MKSYTKPKTDDANSDKPNIFNPHLINCILPLYSRKQKTTTQTHDNLSAINSPHHSG